MLHFSEEALHLDKQWLETQLYPGQFACLASCGLQEIHETFKVSKKKMLQDQDFFFFFLLISL